jgi:hypothetical protein
MQTLLWLGLGEVAYNSKPHPVAYTTDDHTALLLHRFLNTVGCVWSALINTDRHRSFALVPGQCLDGPQQVPV